MQPSPDPRSSIPNLIAYYLRFCRQSRRLTGTAVGELIGADKTKVSDLELAKVALDERSAELLDHAWQTGGLFRLLLHYALIGHNPEWFRHYVELEDQALWIKTWQCSFIPGLLQTREYARASFSCGVWVDDVEADVEQRLARQAILDRPRIPQLWFIISQAVLEIPMGGPEVMRAQLQRLLEISEHPHVSIRIVPKAAWRHPGQDGSFMLLGLSGGDVAFSEAPGGGRLITPISEVREHQVRYDLISQEAEPTRASRLLIRQALEAL